MFDFGQPDVTLMSSAFRVFRVAIIGRLHSTAVLDLKAIGNLVSFNERTFILSVELKLKKISFLKK